MLILQRRKGESLCIGEDIKLTVSEIGSDWVKLAIDAPKEVSILRSELREAALENQEASKNFSSRLLEKLMKEKSL